MFSINPPYILINKSFDLILLERNKYNRIFLKMFIMNPIVAAVLGTIGFLVICAVITISVLWMFKYAQRVGEEEE